jgi:aspartate/methionine/tyrosine aminotransferase
MVGDLWAQNGPAVAGGDIPSVAYLDWYIPMLLEKRTHDLSHSGIQYNWDWPQLLVGEIEELDLWWSIGKGDPRQLVADLEEVSLERIVCMHGVTNGIQIALMAALKSPSAGDERMKRVAVEMPSYAPISQSARLMGLETIPYNRLPQEGHATTKPWLIDRSGLEEILPSVGALVMTPILNPLGWDLTQDDRMWLAQITAKYDVAVISDEVYNHTLRSIGEYKPMHLYGDHCISLSSLTKCHGLGPIRFGWLIASEEVASVAKKVFLNTNGMLSSPGVTMANAIWPHFHKPLQYICHLREKNLPLLESVLEKHCIEWQRPPSGVFGSFEIPGGISGFELVETLGAEHDFLAIPGEMFDPSLKNWLRVAWSIEPELFATAVSVLDEILSEISK